MDARTEAQHDQDGRDDASVEVPTDLKCPITLEIMKDPVMLVQSGNTYERSALIKALAVKPQRDPLTNQAIPHRAVIAPNNAMKRLIVQWTEQGHPIVPPPTRVEGPDRESDPIDLLADMTPPTMTPPEQNNLLEVVDNQTPAAHPAPQTQEPNLVLPTERDVVFGRGNAIHRHPGNILLRSFIDRYVGEYKRGGRTMNKRLVEQVIRFKTSEGVRFLIPVVLNRDYQNTPCRVATRKHIHNKISHMMRDRASRLPH